MNAGDPSADSTVEQRPSRPRFTKVTLYSDPTGLLSFWYAPEWQLQVEHRPLPSIRLTPDPADPDTHLAIVVSKVPGPADEAERQVVMEGIREGLARLADCKVLLVGEVEAEGLWGVEWRCSFSSCGNRYYRHGRLLYSKSHQYAIVFQGSSEESYNYWRGMFGWTMLTVLPRAFDLRQWAKASEPCASG